MNDLMRPFCDDLVRFFFVKIPQAEFWDRENYLKYLQSQSNQQENQEGKRTVVPSKITALLVHRKQKRTQAVYIVLSGRCS